MVTTDGFPLGHEAEGRAPSKVRPALTGVVFAGNRNDARTLKEVVAAMAEGQAPSEVRPALTGVEAKYGKAKRIWPKVRFLQGPAGPDGPGCSTEESRAKQTLSFCANEAGNTSSARRR